MWKKFILWLARPALEAIEAAQARRAAELVTYISKDSSGKAGIVIERLESARGSLIHELAYLQNKERAELVKAMLEVGSRVNGLSECLAARENVIDGQIQRAALSIDNSIAATKQELTGAVRDLINATAPHLALDTLRIWEAVSYACRKWNADTQAQRRMSAVDARREILAWTKAYLTENKWPDPGDNILEIFIDHHRGIDGMKATIAELSVTVTKLADSVAALTEESKRPVLGGMALFDR